jgi:hypothetical protein
METNTKALNALLELVRARIALRAGLPGQPITIGQAQAVIALSHEAVGAAILMLHETPLFSTNVRSIPPVLAE